jgi:hypothetical protein
MKPEDESRWKLWEFFSKKKPELTPEAEALQLITKYLNNANSFQHQVFDDFTLTQHITALLLEPNITEIEKRERSKIFDNDIKAMNERAIKFKRYLRENTKIQKITEPYYRFCESSSSTNYERHFKFARGLKESKQVMDRKSLKPQA